MSRRRNISLYDIEEILRGAGAERIHEKAVLSFEAELEETVKELVNEAQFYANYAGRKNLITNPDIVLAANDGGKTRMQPVGYGRTRVARIKRIIREAKAKSVIEVRQI